VNTLVVGSFLAVLILAVPGETAGRSVRFAQFNIWELSRAKLDEVDRTGRGANLQLRRASEVLQRVRPDVLLINEIDLDGERLNVRLLQERYLGVSQSGQEPLRYPHVYFEAVNTGVPSGLDLDRDGARDGPEDAWGFGRYPGQYGMALLSAFPIERERARSFRLLRWARMPGNLIPDGRGGRPAWYTAEQAERLRLSSKSHWDVPIRIGGVSVHVLAAHPTPPVFDGPEDRNGRRNFDEIRLLADYIRGGEAAAWIADDAGAAGGLEPGAPFVVMGDLNADPLRSEAPYGLPAMRQLLDLPRVVDPLPTGAGSAGEDLPGPPRFPERRTTGFGRVDYVLPSRELEVRAAGVFWPAAGDPLRVLTEDPDPASDHHLVWVDLFVPEAASSH
jgi:endonuclease/exonuclease/phosphatase family metal-dependent hydrolase